MTNKTKGAGDDYPVIQQVKEELCPTCGSACGNINGMYCSNSFHLATPAIQKELASLKEVVKELIPIAELFYRRQTLDPKSFVMDNIDLFNAIERAKRLSDNK